MEKKECTFLKPELAFKADRIWVELKKRFPEITEKNSCRRVIIFLGGCSGCGKTTVAEILSDTFQRESIGCLILHGDNYPYRIPGQNDEERMRIFREYGLRGMVNADVYTKERFAVLRRLQESGEDANPDQIRNNPWLVHYQEGGKQGLREYLGSPKEQDFAMVKKVISDFKNGAESLWLRKMGKSRVWFEQADMKNVSVLILEWTHANSKYLNCLYNDSSRSDHNAENCLRREISDLSVYLDATPQETLAWRRQRGRDDGVDSPFTAMVLAIEQEQLEKQQENADLVIYGRVDNGPMLNAYPDSMGGRLSDIIQFLNQDGCQDAFQAVYILPSLYHSDLDRGFCVIDYDIDERYTDKEDLKALCRMGMQLKLDFVLNHASANSPQFLDLMEKGNDSEYKDFFINWNHFWEGCGDMAADGCIVPDKALIKDMFFRKSGLPVLMVPFPNGESVPYWNTFYQEICPDGKILGQMDLNLKSPLVWKYYEDTIAKLAAYGAKIVRLDAFAYADKAPGARNFLNEPGTWELLDRVRALAEPYEIALLPEIHASYAEKTYEVLAQKGYMTYDFFLPGLIIDALEYGCGRTLVSWAKELEEKKIRTVNMLGCHDGIPLLDLQGLLPEERIQEVIHLLVARGGCVKNLHGQKNIYYQVNAAYYSALGEDDDKMLLARALQIFMPGIPQVWYLDLLAGENDPEAVNTGSHKDINRTNLTVETAKERMKLPVVQEQLKLLRFRNTFRAFGFDAGFTVSCAGEEGEVVRMCWENKGYRAELTADLRQYTFRIDASDPQYKS